MFNVFELDSKLESLVEKLNWYVENKLNIKHKIFGKYIWILAFCIDFFQTMVNMYTSFSILWSFMYAFFLIIMTVIYTYVDYESKRSDDNTPGVAIKFFIDMRFILAFLFVMNLIITIISKKYEFISISSTGLYSLAYYMLSSKSTPPKKETERQTGEIYQGV